MSSFLRLDPYRLVAPLCMLSRSLLMNDDCVAIDTDDPLLVNTLLHACFSAAVGRGTSFEQVVGTVLAMRVRALCAIGITRPTCRHLFGNGVMLHETLVARTFSLVGCEGIDVSECSSQDLLQLYADHVLRRKSLEVGVRVRARDGPDTGRWDILVKLGDDNDMLRCSANFRSHASAIRSCFRRF